jgi:hypothetical protein
VSQRRHGEAAEDRRVADEHLRQPWKLAALPFIWDQQVIPCEGVGDMICGNGNVDLVKAVLAGREILR